MRILTKKRGFTRLGAILFGLKSRAANVGWMRSILKSAIIILSDSLRTCLQLPLKLGLIYPMRLSKLAVRATKSLMTRDSKQSSSN